MKPIQRLLAFAPILALGLVTTAFAESPTWSWSLPIDGPHEITRVWQEEDGATGHSFALASGQSQEISGDHDTKIVVVHGLVSIGSAQVSQLGFATMPSGTPYEIGCMSEEACRVFVEVEPSTGTLTQTSISREDIPWFDVPNTGGAVSLAWVRHVMLRACLPFGRPLHE